ncbi:MAG: hypothetical protein HY291_01810 [Planctomycetes bacterium]|nr:hypothetical protein [Planctomycetota bacterium]
MKEKIVLVGAGSAMFTRGLVADLIRRNWEIELALVDTDPEALRVAEGLTQKMIEAKRAPVKLRAALDRREVLADATAVICTVGVGGRRGWELDVQIPRKYGIYQPVGDSVMPGGTSRALRMIPAMIGVAEDVLELAPNALFFNYGNPMAATCRGVRKATGAPVVGLCHGVYHVAQQLARMLDVPFADFKYTAVGINHCTWFVECRVRGHDAMPRLREVAAEQLAKMAQVTDLGTKIPEAGATEKEALSAERLQPFCGKLFHIFGAYPAVGDRHVSEFFPRFFPGGKYHGKTLGVDAYNIEKVIAWGDKIYADMRELALAPKPLEATFFDQFGGEHEQVIDIIDSIRTDAGRVYSANLPNQGQVPNLPPEAIVEGPAVAGASGLRPIAQPPLAAGIAGMLGDRFQWCETVAEAAIEGSRAKFVQALVLDGAVSDLDVAERLADDLLAAHAHHLPQFKGKR